jgi:predicted nuclease of predicted toxin-antitoxin system
MKFLVDAHFSRRLMYIVREAGHDAIHTSDLPLQNRTPDDAINEISLTEERVVVTKDSDFVSSHLIYGRPWKLLLISTGNIKNSDLHQLVEQNLGRIVEAFGLHSYIELGRSHLTIHQ